MKKFKFSLQKVLEYNEHICKKEKDVLAVLRSELFELQIVEKNIIKKIKSCKEAFLLRCEQGIPAAEVASSLLYINDLRKLLEMQKKLIAEKETQVQIQTVKVTNVMKEKAKTEKIRDSKLEEYKKLESREEEKFIEEFLAYKNSAMAN